MGDPYTDRCRNHLPVTDRPRCPVAWRRIMVQFPPLHGGERSERGLAADGSQQRVFLQNVFLHSIRVRHSGGGICRAWEREKLESVRD